jgi:hypothetical protein
MPRLKPAVEKWTDEEGWWTDWVYPLHKGYRIGCCDCHLIHDFEFRVVEIENHRKGKFNIKTEKLPARYRISYRVRRNNRATAQVRRHKKKPAHKGRGSR